MYIHGFDSSGDPADTAGSAYYDGQTITIPAGEITTPVETMDDGFILLSTDDVTFTDTAAGRIRRVSGAAQWQYYNGSVWTNFTPTGNEYAIGTFSRDGSAIVSAALTGLVTLTTLI
ncbi:MAG: hypothetical protein GWN30_21685, partial [Gammaproteobacteria bacterium]|nr:hypothetical protein [Gammaproteobacteria bacterium]